MNLKIKLSKKDGIFFAVIAIICGGLFFIPAPQQLTKQTGIREKAEVLAVDNSDLQVQGLIRFGSQCLKVKIVTGPYRGQTFDASNEIRGQLELDKQFKVGDKAVVVYHGDSLQKNTILTAQDYDRNTWTFILITLFCLLLCVFGRWTGVKALFSFVFSCFMIWKVIVPLVLRGFPASWTIFACVVLLTAVIMFLIAGFTRKGLSAFAGAITGVFAGLLMANLFTRLMQVNGATLPYSQTLLYSGYQSINLQDIFIGAMILAASGAVMDLAMDIASGVEEVAHHNPKLSRKELTASGLRQGRSVVGTMTTTLLLAYSGGYITLLMVFCAQGNTPMDFINNPLVAAEMVKTLIGSFSLILVAPFTAFASGWIFKKSNVQ